MQRYSNVTHPRHVNNTSKVMKKRKTTINITITVMEIFYDWNGHSPQMVTNTSAYINSFSQESNSKKWGPVIIYFMPKHPNIQFKMSDLEWILYRFRITLLKEIPDYFFAYISHIPIFGKYPLDLANEDQNICPPPKQRITTLWKIIACYG